MEKIKVVINDITVKDDYSTDPSYLIRCEIEEELDEIIPSLELELKNTIYDLMTLSQNQVVEVFSGDVETRVFYGQIIDIKNEGASVKIQALMETQNLLRKKINKIYTSDEAHEGKNELIVKDLIERAGLTAEVETPSEPNILAEFKCIQAVTYERILSLLKAIDYQLRYDPVTRTVHYEPRGFIDNSKTLTVGTEIVGLPEWEETTEGLINNLRIDGATTETQITESGTIGTTEGWTTTGIELSKTPNIVELIADGTQRIGGTKDASIGHYYWVDRENKKIMPKTGTTFTNGHVVTINYSWSAPAPVQDFRQESIDTYGEFEEVFNFSDISSVADAESRIEKILDTRSTPFITAKIKVRDFSPQVGEKLRVIDNITTPNQNRRLVVNSVKWIYPSGFEEITAGDKEWKLEDDIIEMENRIKRLEEQFVRNQDLLLQLIRLQDNAQENAIFPKERYIKVYEKNIGGDVGIYGNSDFGVYGVAKYGSEADQSFILGKSKLGLNALGSKTSEEVLKVVKSYGEYTETFYDEDFKGSGNWSGSYADTESDISDYISYREKTINSAKITADYTGDLTFYLDNGNGWEEATSEHTFASSGNSLKWKTVSNGISQLNSLKIEY